MFERLQPKRLETLGWCEATYTESRFRPNMASRNRWQVNGHLGEGHNFQGKWKIDQQEGTQSFVAIGRFLCVIREKLRMPVRPPPPITARVNRGNEASRYP